MQYNIYLFSSNCGISKKMYFKVIPIQAMKTKEESGVEGTLTLKPGARWRQIVASQLGHLPHEKSPKYRLKRDCTSARTGL
jgi:hypothetical protein